MMGGIRDCVRPIYTSTTTINTLSNMVKVRVSDILRPTSTSFTTTPTIYSFRLVYTQKSTMTNWVMGGRVDGMGPLPNSPITNNSFSHFARGKVAGLFRPRSTSTIINSCIHPRVTIIKTYIYPPIIIIITDINLLFLMNSFLYMTRRYW